MVKSHWWSDCECAWLTWGSKVNLIGLTNFISIVIVIPLWLHCHEKLILVTPFWSKVRKLGAFGSYILTYCSKTWLERNVFQSRNLHLWNTNGVKSVALGRFLIYSSLSRLRWSTSAVLLLFWAKGHRVHLALVFTVSLSEVENSIKPCRICKTFWSIQTMLHRGLQGLRWKLDACALWK